MKLMAVGFAFAFVIAGVAVPARATLTPIGKATYSAGSQSYEYNLIYDNEGPYGPVVWLDFSLDARTYSGSKELWIGEMNTLFEPNTRYDFDPGYDVTWLGGWRLPKTNVPEFLPSEMRHLYTEFGAAGTGPFTQVRRDWTYWSEPDEYYWPSNFNNRPYPAFSFTTGAESLLPGGGSASAMALRAVQVSSAVPLPGSLFLLGPGLACLAALRRRFKR